ncbi:MAG: hypothetical protein V3S82_10380 [Dehalococcoidia bacterium]
MAKSDETKQAAKAPDPDKNYVWCQFTKDQGDYKEGSTWRLDSSLASHFLKVEKCCRKVKRPDPKDRMGPQAGRSLSNQTMRG